MATYYFDTNGATAGFGTLTGNWNPSTALWSTSTAGTAATAAVTFTNADVAQFGFAGTAGTAGTATITAAVTNTVNQVVTANLAGTQTIAGPGTLELAGTTPTINVGSAGGLTISAPITGTAGFTKSGSGNLTVTGNLSGLLGTISQDQTTGGGLVFAGPASQIPALTFAFSKGTTGAKVLSGRYTQLVPSFTNTFTLPAGFAFTGTGSIATDPRAATAISGEGLSFPFGALSGLTGTDAPSAASDWWPVSGFAPFSQATSSIFYTNITTIRDLPSVLTFGFWIDVNSATLSNSIFYKSSEATHNYPTQRIDVLTASTATIGTCTASLYANQATGALVLGGGIRRYNQTGTRTVTLVLRGTSPADNTISGDITEPSGALALAKADAGKWILSGANTYTGATSISAGTLSAQSTTAFGSTSAGAVTMTGGTIDVSGNVAFSKGNQALTLISAAGATALSTTTGTNTLACAGITLSSTIIVAAAAGASLTVNNTAAMSGAFGITKNDSGEIGLGTFANTYTGAVTINAGTLTVGNLQNTSTASSLGTGALSSAIALTGTLKYNGTGHSTNRSITFTGAAPALDASGTGAVTYSACTQAAGARTITLTGTSLAAVNNTFSATLADGTGAVGVAKTGSNKWVLSGALNHTGTTSCAEGTLNFGSTNRTLSGALSVSGGTVENSTNTISANTTMTGGTITAQLTGNKTLDVTSGSATLQPVNNVNDFSGATTVAAGATLKLITGLNPSLGSGRVLGTSNVSVSGNLRTDGSATQKGQMRYGGNLTFQAGAKLYVGSLA